MADPILREQDVKQSEPERIILGRAPIIELDVFENDGTGRPNPNPTNAVNSATCTVYNVTDLTASVATPSVTVTAITNGYRLSFQIDTTASPFDAAGRFLADLQLTVNGTEIPSDPDTLFYFNIVALRNVFGDDS